jgi:DNA mismatch repair protein MSH5
MDNTVGIGCVGAVIFYLDRKRVSEYLQDDPNAQMAYQVVRLEMFSIRDTM